MPSKIRIHPRLFAFLAIFGLVCIVASAVDRHQQSIFLIAGILFLLVGAGRLWWETRRRKAQPVEAVEDVQQAQEVQQVQQAQQVQQFHEVKNAPKKVKAEAGRAVEQQLWAIVDGSTAGLFLMDLEGRIVQTNRAFQKMIGFPEGTLEGRKPEEFTMRTDAQADADLFKQLVAGKRDSYQVEKRYVRQNTQTLWGYVTASLVRDQEGQPQFVTCMVQDITDDRRSGAALRDIEQLFRLTFDQAAVGVAHTDRDGRFMFVNHRFCDMFGRKREDLFGREFRSVVHADDVDEVEAALQQLLSGDIQVYSGEQRYVRQDGSGLWGNLTMSLMRQPSGEPKYGIVMIEDVTERKQTQEALRESEEQYRAITETASDAILTLCDDGRILFANPAATTIFGYMEEELVGQPLSLLLPEDGKPYLSDSEGSTSTMELPGRHKDGQDLHLEVAFAESRRQNERMFTGVIRDITERKRAEAERAELLAREQEARAMSEAATVIRGVVQASPLPILTVDPEGNVASWNAAAAATFGWFEEDVIGGPIPFVPQGRASEADEFQERALDGESVTNLEIRVETRDREMLDLYMSTAPVRDAHGAITGVMYVYADITKRKRTEEALAKARDQALEASRLKSEFLATMSHEIRTPMNAIIGMNELLLDTPLDTEQKEYVTVVGNSAQALLALINDILDFSRIEADKLVLDSVDFEPLSIVEAAAELLAAKAREKNLSLMTYVDPRIPDWLRGDAGRLRQVIVNLIGNAVKFTDSGDVSVEVTLETTNESGVMVRFAVSDTGIGLSEVARQRLFQPFVQADGSTTRKYGGTGLGLAICKRLVELMDGTIGVESEEGEGSTFWFTACFTPTTLAPAAPASRPNLDGVKVLVVGGSQVSRRLLHQSLEAAGVRSDEAVTGQDALGRLVQAPVGSSYDAVITEMTLPDMDASALGRTMGQDHTLKHTPVILLTASEKRVQAEGEVESTFAAYLMKPVKQAHIVDAIASVASAHDQPAAEAPAPQPQVEAPRSKTVAPVAAPVPVAPPPVFESAAPKSGALLLLVEDNVNNQIMAMRQLEKLGHGVHVVSNGLQAVKALAYKSNRYDIVFMDCQMPEMDGYTATREIRNAEMLSGRRIPIVAMTANAMSGDRETCIAAGMDDYIPKPISRQVLVEALERWLPREGANVSMSVA